MGFLTYQKLATCDEERMLCEHLRERKNEPFINLKQQLNGNKSYNF